MTVGWTSPQKVAAALGSAAPPPGDAYLADCVDAANAWCWRKRDEAGYDDDDTDDAPAPSPDVAMGATLYAVALWRERASTDGYPSFEDLSAFAQTGGSSAQIRRLLGIGRAAVDAAPASSVTAARRWRW